MLSEFITISLLFSFPFRRLNTHLLVILLQRSQVLPCLRELALFHPFTDVPMHKSTLGVHQVELMVNARENLRNGRRVADHAARTHHLRQVATRNHCRGLVVDSTLEACGTPIHELDSTLGLDGSDGRIDIL